jgi:hypothetical protein
VSVAVGRERSVKKGWSIELVRGLILVSSLCLKKRLS